MTSHDLLTYAARVLIWSCGVGIVATFVNALGATITVNDTLSVLAQVAVATHGQFVFSVPAVLIPSAPPV